MKVINIVWESIPFTEEAIAELNKNIDKGLYQIYGRHNAYGKNVLLYIGKTYATFSQRLKKRFEFLESSSIPECIRIGRITKSTYDHEELGWDELEWDNMIALSETLLIIAHTPAFNKVNNSGLMKHEDPNSNIHILNWGDFGDLLPEVSTIRNSYMYWHFEKELGTE